MAVPMTEVGEECDKIGVSFESFRYQSNGCGRAPGSCLKVSPEKLRKEDDDKVESGGSAEYMLTSFGDIVGLSDESSDSNTEKLYVAFYPVQSGVSTSLLSVSIIADDLSFVATESAAKILDGYVDDFEAMDVAGTLHVTLQNLGGLKSSYIVQVPSCSSVVNPITPQTITMQKEEVQHRKFDLSVTTVMSYDLYCDVQVLSAHTGRIYDVYRVWFKPRELVLEPPSDEGGNDSSVTYSVASPGQCNKSCGLNIFCMFSMTECVIYPVLLLVLIVGVIIGVIACIKKVPCCKPCCKACCCLPCKLCRRICGDGKKKKQQNNNNNNNNIKVNRKPIKQQQIRKKEPASIKVDNMDNNRSRNDEKKWESYLNITITESNRKYMTNNRIIQENETTSSKIAIKGFLIMKGNEYFFIPEPAKMSGSEDVNLSKIFKCKLTSQQVRERISRKRLPNFYLIN